MLLEYLCEASSLKKVVMPLGAVTLADVDLDNVSVNYVLEACKSRGTLDLAEAIKQHFKELSLAPSFGTGDSEIFLLATNPKHSGGPPARPAPEKPGPSYAHLGAGASRSVPGTPSRSSSIKASPGRPLTPTESYEDGVEEFEDLDDEPVAKKQFADTKELVLTLPAFETGLTDDDIRETAYEVGRIRTRLSFTQLRMQQFPIIGQLLARPSRVTIAEKVTYFVVGSGISLLRPFLGTLAILCCIS